jgi:hypothetical protein
MASLCPLFHYFNGIYKEPHLPHAHKKHQFQEHTEGRVFRVVSSRHPNYRVHALSVSFIHSFIHSLGPFLFEFSLVVFSTDVHTSFINIFEVLTMPFI